jgi:hypothetical protein
MAISRALGLELEIADRCLRPIGSVIAIMVIATLQYTCKSLTSPLTVGLHLRFVPIQTALVMLISTQTRLTPSGSYLLDCPNRLSVIASRCVLVGMNQVGVGFAPRMEFMRASAEGPGVLVKPSQLIQSHHFCYENHPQPTA